MAVKDSKANKQKDFFQQVYAVVRQVPSGRVTSYGAIARYLGAPQCPCSGLCYECSTY